MHHFAFSTRSVEKRPTSASTDVSGAPTHISVWRTCPSVAISDGGKRGSRSDMCAGASQYSLEAEVGRFEQCDLCFAIVFVMKNVTVGEKPLVRDRALVFSPRAPFAFVSEISEKSSNEAGGAAGGVWGGMPPRPPHCGLRSPFSDDFQFSAKLCRFLNKVRTFFAENPDA